MAMLKSDEEDGPAAPSVIVISFGMINSINMNVLGTWEQSPPCTPVKELISDELRLDIPHEPSTDKRIMSYG